MTQLNTDYPQEFNMSSTIDTTNLSDNLTKNILENTMTFQEREQKVSSAEPTAVIARQENLGLTPLKFKSNGELDIKDTLIDICSYCRGHDGAGELFFRDYWLKPALEQLGVVYSTDELDNIYVNSSGSGVLYAAHIDTMHSPKDERITQTLTLSNGILAVPKKQKSVLGADDAVGITVILWLLSQKIDISAIFLRGEERGLIGAGHAAEVNSDWLAMHTMCIEVDRQDQHEIITHQAPGRCASDEFAKNLAKQLGMGHKPSNLGVYTDNSEFSVIPECINLAAGYVNQHSENEVCDVGYVVELCQALTKVDYTLLGNHRYEGDDEGAGWDSLWGSESENDYLMDIGSTSNKTDDRPFETLEDVETYVMDNWDEVMYYIYMKYTTPRDITNTYNSY